MNETEGFYKAPVKVVRFGMGKELRLFTDELVVTGVEDNQEIRLRLESIGRLILVPGDPNPSKLVLLADLDDDTPRLDIDLLWNLLASLCCAVHNIPGSCLYWRSSLRERKGKCQRPNFSLSPE